jgi:hypothetical protein
MMPSQKRSLGLVCGAIFITTLITLSGITDDPLWFDEGWSMWAVRDGLGDMLRRVAQDVHPPLYFLILYGWVKVAGESEFSARILSLFMGWLGIGAVYRIGEHLVDKWHGLAAGLFLGTHAFFIYQAREVRMYMLLMTLASLSIWAYLRWSKHPSRRWGYILAVTALLYTHYYGILIVFTQLTHLILTKRDRVKGWIKLMGSGFLLYLPWIPSLIGQFLRNSSGPVSTPIPVNFDTIRWLLLLITSGIGGLVILPFVLNQFRTPPNHNRQQAGLISLWLFLTPTSLLLLNLHFRSVYQIRYISAVIPAFALALAYGLRYLRWGWISIPLLIVFMAMSVDNYAWLWFPKSTWDRQLGEAVIAQRQAGEPTLLLFTTQAGMEAYYARRLHFHNDWAIDLGEEAASANEVAETVSQISNEPVIWVVLPPEKGESWLVMSQLNQTHWVDYRVRNASLVIYRFSGQGEKLQLSFGDQFEFISPLSFEPLQANKGEPFCLGIQLKTLVSINNEYSFGLHLADKKRNLVTQIDAGLGFHPAGDYIKITPCLDIPPTLRAGDYYLHFVIYTWQDARRLSVLESGIYWDNALLVGALKIE